MHIHFVCSGNSYRSRLAEAYLKSKLSSNEVTVSSSGTEAEKHKFSNGPICWYAMRLMKRKELIPHMSWKERQATKEVLKDVDLLICMRQAHLDLCQNELDYVGKSEVWEIPDLNEMDDFIPSSKQGIETDVNHINLTEQTFNLIVGKVDSLILNNKI
jgi:protein-tyrosine-phosphatase